MYLGIDLGTSAVKVVVVDEAQRVVGQASAPLDVSRPQPLWSEQDPEAWWRATGAAIAELRTSCARELDAVRGIGLSGQMHGATLLDAGDRVLRPCILWNDGRAGAECAELERRAPELRQVAGNAAMPGFTAPKLLWVAGHEPDIFRRVATVLLPKDWLRLRMTGERVSDLSDASGTLWLDVGMRCWSDALLAATGLAAEAMPALVEGSAESGRLRAEIAADWRLPEGVVVAGGAGDQAAGAIGAGVIEAGQAFLALGTSGVLFAAGDRFAPNPEGGVHAFCHALPGRWHQMSVILSAASCLDWAAGVLGLGDAARLVEAAESAGDSGEVLFLPYLSGERTPHDDPHAKGVFFGMSFDTRRGHLARAVLEGVGFALADGQEALLAAGASIDRLAVIGGGARSRTWGRILASALGRPLDYAADAEIGPAFGAARLGRLAAGGEEPSDVCRTPDVAHVVQPDAALAERLATRLRAFRALYPALRPCFAASRRTE